jgi:hypothetical protein
MFMKSAIETPKKSLVQNLIANEHTFGLEEV